MIPMKTLPCFHGRKGCAFPGAVFFCVKNRKSVCWQGGEETKNIRQTSKIRLTIILDKCRILVEGRDKNMKLSRKLLETEFEIMKVFWEKELHADLNLFDIKMKRKTDG